MKETGLPALGPLERSLRETVVQISPLSTQGCQPSEYTWREYTNQLREDILAKDPRTFLDWWVVRHTMYTVGHPEWAEPQLEYLRSLPDWETRWLSAVQEPDIGHPARISQSICTSETAICHAYCLAQFEHLTGHQVSDYPAVFEFGGGYGGMCRTVHDLGFSGEYILYDFPTMLALARYYLQASGYGDVLLVSGSDDVFLSAMLDGAVEGALFISTWALSEAPLALRNCVLCGPFAAYLVAYQHAFHEVDNSSYFTKWIASYTDVGWHTWEFPGNPDSHGVAGIRRD